VPDTEPFAGLLDAALFQRLDAEVRARHGVGLLAVDAEGVPVFGKTCGTEVSVECRAVWQRLVREAWNWGEPALSLCPAGRILCGVPIMRNSVLLGGLVTDGLPAEPDSAAAAPREAGETLLALAISHNLTNAAHLELRRTASDRERERAEAIHSLKASGYSTIRSAYLREEPVLLAAVKRGDRREAREILNRLLVGIYHLGGQRIELLKSLTLELVVMMYRAAVEAGARPAELLGMNYDSVGKLATVTDEEQLCHWLTDVLERLMDGIREYRDPPNTILLQQALRYMEQNLGRDLSRDDVARVACLSPSHFSHLVKEKVGRSFRDLLLDARTARAAELLRRSPRSVADIAAACGFGDQSHFGKVFRRRTGLAPLAYRRRHAAVLSADGPDASTDECGIAVHTVGRSVGCRARPGPAPID
jgi:AraC-like DNA-binding protein